MVAVRTKYLVPDLKIVSRPRSTPNVGILEYSASFSYAENLIIKKDTPNLVGLQKNSFASEGHIQAVWIIGFNFVYFMGFMGLLFGLDILFIHKTTKH
jgi:hypothetical protein